MAIAMSVGWVAGRSPAVPAGIRLGVDGVAKAEWGSKRICLSCGAKFYDLNRTPIHCPACEAVFDPTANSKPRRARAPAKAVAATPAVAVAAAVAEVDDDDDALVEDPAVVVADDADDDDSESAIEDVSELGDDDMSDVIDTEIDEEDSER
jgi:uncharacterized protein (TIGR02300 family)